MGDARMTSPTMLLRGALADEVRAEARRIDPAKLLLTVLALLPFLLGWVAAQTVRGTWVALSWTWAAMVVGWRTAYGRSGGG
jgi:hypothetical protein